MEIWKDIKGYDVHYQISNFGRVKSFKSNKILKSKIGSSGYLQIVLCKNCTRKNQLIHRLIALYFIPNPDNKPCTNHKNGIKTDNRLENLEWATYSENTIHSFKNGLQKPTKSIDAHFAKINHKIAREIRKLYATNNYSYAKIASKYNLSSMNVWYIVNYKTWK